MIDGLAGGHTFLNGECSCGRRLTDVQWITLEDVNKPDIAHTGLATAYEVEQIMRLAKQMRVNMANVFGWNPLEQDA